MGRNGTGIVDAHSVEEMIGVGVEPVLKKFIP